MTEFAVAIGFAVVALLWFLWVAIRIVTEYQRLVVFRLGRCIGQKGPGIVILIPVIDRAVRVDLREQFLEIAHQTCITKDNAPISIDFLIYSRVVGPVLSVVKVQDFVGASQGGPRPRSGPLWGTSPWTTCWPSGSRSTRSCARSWTR